MFFIQNLAFSLCNRRNVCLCTRRSASLCSRRSVSLRNRHRGLRAGRAGPGRAARGFAESLGLLVPPSILNHAWDRFPAAAGGKDNVATSILFRNRQFPLEGLVIRALKGPPLGPMGAP